MSSACFVTGGAGFIGSHLVDALLSEGRRVTVYDNFSTGFKEFLSDAGENANLKVVNGDLLDSKTMNAAMAGCDEVYHLSANADIRFGLEQPDRDLQQNTIATFNVLEAMRANGVKRIAFSSTGSVYGEPEVFPTPENAPFPVQTSLYAASKISGEALISAYAEGYGFQGFIFRFVSVLGERYTHGHVFDFVKKLRDDPEQLPILGDGKQRKSYIYVGDCVAAIRLAMQKAEGKINIFNLGADEYVEVAQSARWIATRLGVQPKFNFAGGARGWVGDSPFIFLDTTKIRQLGWKPRQTIESAIGITADWLVANPWVYERRA